MQIDYQVNPPVDNARLDDLYFASWPNHPMGYDFNRELSQNLAWVYAWADTRLIGFVRMAWDGGIHGFLLEPTVHPDFRRQGIGVQLVKTVVEAARERGIEWVHVDYEPHLITFYEQCGFVPTHAGLLHLKEK